jgi:PKD repeat protein
MRGACGFHDDQSKIGCAPLAVSFNGAATGTAPFTWSWNFGGVPPNVNPATSTSQNPAVQFNTPGKYVITLTATNASGTSLPITDTVTVYGVPVADFTPSITTGCYPIWVNFNDRRHRSWRCYCRYL